MKAFNHAFTIAFSYETLDPDADTSMDSATIRDNIIARANDAHENNELIESVGAPFDTYDFDVPAYKSGIDYVVVINEKLIRIDPNGSNAIIGTVKHGTDLSNRYGTALPDDAGIPEPVLVAIEQRLGEGV